MWVHWTNKQIKFTHHGKRILLKGLNHDVEHCPSVKEAKLRGLLKRQALTHCIQFQFASEPHIQWEQATSFVLIAPIQDTTIPKDVQKLITLFDDVFQTPTTLPPPRAFDH
jgi:hypothetical protein